MFAPLNTEFRGGQMSGEEDRDHHFPKWFHFKVLEGSVKVTQGDSRDNVTL